jgi:multiple sugar transport system substrate-binding protein
MNNAQSTSWYYVNGTEEFNATLDSVFSSVWAGEETMEEAINENLEELQDIFAENNG